MDLELHPGRGHSIPPALKACRLRHRRTPIPMRIARQQRLPTARGIAGLGLLAVALLAAGCSGGGGSSIVIPPLSRVVISFGGDTTVVADTLNVGLNEDFDAIAYDLSGNPVA